MTPPSISILISAFSDRERQLELSLQSIVGQKYNKNCLELLVFCDFLRPKTIIALLKKYSSDFGGVRYYLIPKKKSLVSHSATRRNFLATKAKGKYILFSEPEMLHIGPTLSWLFISIEKLKKNIWYCGPIYGTSSIVDSKGKISIYEGAPKEDVDYLLGLVKRYKNDFLNKRIVKHFYKIDKKGCPYPFFCTLFNRNFFLQLGGLNQDLKVRGWEEIEFSKRFKENGGEVHFDNNFITCHLPHKRSISPEKTLGWDLYNSTVVFNQNQRIGDIEEDVREVILT